MVKSLDMDSQNEEPHVKGAAAFSKFMAVLQVIADSPGEYDVSRLSRLLPYPRSTVYRIVSALGAEGMVVEDQKDGSLRLGLRLISLASKSWDELDLRVLARDHLQMLRDVVGETVHLAVPSETEMVYIDKLESPRSVRMASRIGTRVPLHSTSVGKAYLAALRPAVFDALLARLPLPRMTPHTIVDPQALRAEVDRIRRDGVSVDFQENELEIRCFGAAILGRDGAPVGCVSISIPLYRYDEKDAAMIRSALQGAVERISMSAMALR